EERKEMTKCTLCVDRIYNESLDPRDRRPACVMACPTNARLFGDIHDPESEAGKAIRERDGYQLMPEWGSRPANHYLPGRKTAPHAPETMGPVGDALDQDSKLPKPSPDEPSLDDAMSW